MSKFLPLLLALLCCAPPAAAQDPDPETKLEVPSEAYDGVAHIKFVGSVGANDGKRIVQAFVEAQEEKPEIIVFEMNTTGGNVDEGFLISKAIEESTVPVICVVDGEALSMGFYILQSCPRRVMTNRSRLMVHDAGLVLPGGTRLTPALARNYLRQLDSLVEGMDQHWGKRLKMDLKKFKQTMAAKGDWWMTAKQAEEIGAIDTRIDSSRSFVEGLKRAHRIRKALESPTPFPLPFPTP